MQLIQDNKVVTITQTEDETRNALQVAIKAFIRSGGAGISLGDGTEGITFFETFTEGSASMIVRLELNNGSIRISLADRITGGDIYKIDADFDPEKNTYNSASDNPTLNGTPAQSFFKEEFEQLQKAIDEGQLKDIYGKHHIRTNAQSVVRLIKELEFHSLSGEVHINCARFGVGEQVLDVEVMQIDRRKEIAYLLISADGTKNPNREQIAVVVQEVFAALSTLSFHAVTALSIFTEALSQFEA